MLTCWDSTETVRSFAGEAPSRWWVLDEIRPTLEPVERTGAAPELQHVSALRRPTSGAVASLTESAVPLR